MSRWDQFANIDAKALNEQANNLSDADFEEVPNGKYEVSLDSLELKESKKGFPMMAARFTILEGAFKNRKVFMNQLVLMGNDKDAFRVHTCNVFLRSLASTLSTKVAFEGLDAYDFLISSIATECANAEYLLELGDHNGFRTFKILERFDQAPVPTQPQTAPMYAQQAPMMQGAPVQMPQSPMMQQAVMQPMQMQQGQWAAQNGYDQQSF